jgi:hypothetical protein
MVGYTCYNIFYDINLSKKIGGMDNKRFQVDCYIYNPLDIILLLMRRFNKVGINYSNYLISLSFFIFLNNHLLQIVHLKQHLFYNKLSVIIGKSDVIKV